MKSIFPKSIIAAGLGVAWLFAVIFSYYIEHKPFTADNALAVINVVGDLAVAIAMLALAAAVGRRATRGIAFATPLEELVLQAGLGFGLESVGTLILGVCGLLNRILFWVILAVALFLLWSDLASVGRALRKVKLPIGSRWESTIAILIATCLAAGLLYTLTPPVAWDAQTYHLVEAQTALNQGRIGTPPDIVYFSFPSLVEMLFLAAMALKGDIAAQLVHFEYLLLALGALFALAQRFFNARVGWLSCAIIVAVPSLLSVATWAYVDVALMFYTLAAFFSFLIARETKDKRWFALVGAFSGLAMGVKYTSAIIPVALIAMLLWSRDTRRLSYLLWVCVFAAVFAAPWYIRNLAFTGNPVYPFVFGGANWDSFRAEWFSRFGTGLVADPIRLLLAPWDATIHGSEGAVGYEASIGPLILALLPFLLLTLALTRDEKVKSVVLRYVLSFTGFLYAFWLFGIAGSSLLIQTRLLFPAFPTLALAAAVAVERLPVLDLKQFSLYRFARLTVILVIGVTTVSYVLSFAGSGNLAYLAGAETRQSFLARSLGTYGAAVQYVNTKLPTNAHLLFLWEPRSYYVRRIVQPDAILDSFAHLYWKYRDASKIAGALTSAGYTHVLLHRAGLDYVRQPGGDPIPAEAVTALQEFADNNLKLVYGTSPFQVVMEGGGPSVMNAEQDAYAIYEIVTPGSR